MTSPPNNPKTETDRQHATLERLIHEEIRKQETSHYWRGLITPPVASENDFDRKKMGEDYARQFPALNREAILSVINRKVYLLHLR